MRVPLDQFKEFPGANQRGRRGKGPVIFRQRVDVKRLAVDFFGIVQHTPGIIQPPERTAMLHVPKVVHDKIERPLGHLLEQHVGPRLMNGGERPQDAAVDDEALGLRAVGLELVGQPAHPAALLVVQRRSAPERQDVAEQLVADALRKILQFI